MENLIPVQPSFEITQKTPRIIQQPKPFFPHTLLSWPATVDEKGQLAAENRLQLETPVTSTAFQRRLTLLQFMLDALPQGSMLTDFDGNLVLCNAGLMRLFGLPGRQVEEPRNSWIERFANKVKNSEQLLRVINLILKERTGETLDMIELKTGQLLEVRTQSQVNEPLGESFRMWNFLDCTEQYRRERELQHLSLHDPLTGIYNRAYFEMKISEFRQSAQFPVAMIMLDVDGLKKVNDCQGHLAGDDLLCQVAQILRQACRKVDISSRLGGDEFALLLAQTNVSAVEHVIDRIQGLLNLHNVRHPTLPISLSMGSAVAFSESEMDSLSSRADEAMYSIRRERRAKL